MILDLAASNPLYAKKLTFADGSAGRGPGGTVLLRSGRRTRGRADDLARKFEGRPGVLGVQKCLTAASRDDFWKVRKAGFSLLMAMVGDSKPVAFVEDTAVSPDRLPEFYERFFEIVGRSRSRGRVLRPRRCRLLAYPTDYQCENASGRRYVADDRARSRPTSSLEFGGAMSGEHGDGLRDSSGTRSSSGPKSTPASRPSNAPLTRRT